jgi:hypothetical protein
MHKPSGLGIYGQYQLEDSSGRVAAGLAPLVVAQGASADSNGPSGLSGINGVVFGSGFGGPAVVLNNQETDAWYIKPFWRKTWSPIGATVLYGEYGQYNDQFAAGRNFCAGGFGAGTSIGNFCAANVVNGALDFADTFYQSGGVFATSSEVERYGLGVVQEIDSAAMHLWLRWQHQTMDANFVGYSINGNAEDKNECVFDGQDCSVSKTKLKDSFDDWDLLQIGGVIFF